MEAFEIPKGSVVKYQLSEGPKLEYVVQNNYRSIWVTKDKNFEPPFTRTINWESVLAIYTKEDNPEYFL